MRFPHFAVVFVYLGLPQAIAAPSYGLKARTQLDDFVSKQNAVSLQGALNNIGPNGSEAPGAKAGFVVASPSKVDPPCKLNSQHQNTVLTSPRLLYLDS